MLIYHNTVEIISSIFIVDLLLQFYTGCFKFSHQHSKKKKASLWLKWGKVKIVTFKVVLKFEVIQIYIKKHTFWKMGFKLFGLYFKKHI